jgi:peptidoglycan glycosyltransferase
MAALRRVSGAEHTRYVCRPVGGGRVGNRIPGWNRDIRDDAGDPPHGHPDLARALAVSCNAYFAQLGALTAGAGSLRETAGLFGLSTGAQREFQQLLPMAAMGQGPVLATPFQLARVAATVAAGGRMPQGRWLMDGFDSRTDAPVAVITQRQAAVLANAMRAVVTSGTARGAMSGLDIQMAGKTGTAQTSGGEPHSLFVGFAPFDAPPAERIAFAVVVEHGGYGARVAAPIARELVEAARDLEIIRRN